MGRQKQLHDAEPGFGSHRGKHISESDDVLGLFLHSFSNSSWLATQDRLCAPSYFYDSRIIEFVELNSARVRAAVRWWSRHAGASKQPSPQCAPWPVITRGIVPRMIFQSNANDQLSMYSMSIFIHVSKSRASRPAS